MVGKSISTDVETGSTRLQAGGQISYQEYLNCLPEEIEQYETKSQEEDEDVNLPSHGTR